MVSTGFRRIELSIKHLAKFLIFSFQISAQSDQLADCGLCSGHFTLGQAPKPVLTIAIVPVAQVSEKTRSR